MKSAPGLIGDRRDASGVTWETRDSVTEHVLGRLELAQAATTLRRLLDAIRVREVAAPAVVIARLEGAIIALDAAATGRPPVTDDLLVPGPYTV
jgi:hypothetical protein